MSDTVPAWVNVLPDEDYQHSFGLKAGSAEKFFARLGVALAEAHSEALVRDEDELVATSGEHGADDGVALGEAERDGGARQERDADAADHHLRRGLGVVHLEQCPRLEAGAP